MHREFRDGYPKIELIPCRSAPETAKSIVAQVHGKKCTAARRTSAVDRAGAAQLIARSTDRHKASQFENLGNSDLRANSGEIDSRHCEQFEKQRRGTRTE